MSGMGLRLSSNTGIHKGERKNEPKFLRKRTIFKKPNLNIGVEGIDEIFRFRQCIHYYSKTFPGIYKERDPNPRSIKDPKIGRWLSGWEHVVVLPEDLGFIS